MEETPVGFEPLTAAFRDRLALATPERPLVVLVDALDQLPRDDPAASSAWLPRELAPNARVVVSTTEASDSLRGARTLELPLLPVEDADQALSWRLKGASRNLQADQRGWLLEHFGRCGLPLYLKLAFEEARLWRSFAKHEEWRLGEGIAGIIDTLLERLEAQSNHGPVMTARSLGYLAAARHGLSEDEMLDVLSADNEVWKDFSDRSKHAPPSRRLPVVVWSRFFLDLGPYLAEHTAPGGTVVTFYHRQVAERVAARHLTADRHNALARYFSAQPHWSDSKETQPNGRKAGEVVHQQLGAGLLDGAVQTLTDLQFVAASCAAGLVFDLQRDYRGTIGGLPEAQEELREDARRHAEVERWKKEIIQCCRKAQKQSTPAKEIVSVVPRWARVIRFKQGASIPKVIESVTPWTDDQIAAECERIRDAPTRLDVLRAFGTFVKQENHSLRKFGARPGFAVQHAYNHAPSGPVHEQARAGVDAAHAPMILRRWPPDTRFNPKPALLRTLEGHTEWVRSVSMTPDGRSAVSAARMDLDKIDSELRLWDLDTGVCLRVLEVHGKLVNSVSVTPDCRLAVSGSSDCSLSAWNLETGVCLRTLEGHSGEVLSVSVTPDGRRAVSGSGDRTLRVWDLEAGACLNTLKWRGHWKGYGYYVNDVSVTLDGRRALTANSDKALRLWDLGSGACLRTLEGHSDEVLSVSVTPDGRRAVSGGSDCTLRAWDLKTGTCQRIMEGHTDNVSSVVVSPDGCRAVSASEDRTVRVWDLETGACLRSSERHTEGVEGFSVAPDGLTVVSESYGETRVWDLETGKCVRDLEGGSDDFRFVSVPPDGRRAVSAGPDGLMRVWNLETGACVATLEGHSDRLNTVSVTQDGRRAVSGSSDKTLRVWDLETGTCLRTLEGHTDVVTGVSVAPDGRWSISASEDRTLRVWDLETGACPALMRGDAPWTAVIATAGNRVIAGTATGSVVFFHILGLT